MDSYRKRYATEHAEERKEYMRRYAQENRERRLLWRREKYRSAPQKEKELSRQYYRDHREERKLYASNYVKAHPEQYAAYSGERHALKLKAMPAWADREAISFFYGEAKRLTHLTGIRYVVDHIWPLKGKGFRGLHVSWNLRVITATENSSKSNKRPE